jgi:hypothetical protein
MASNRLSRLGTHIVQHVLKMTGTRRRDRSAQGHRSTIALRSVRDNAENPKAERARGR